jgi:hypothetical protein
LIDHFKDKKNFTQKLNLEVLRKNFSYSRESEYSNILSDKDKILSDKNFIDNKSKGNILLLKS